MITEVFNRVEEKFALTSDQYRQLICNLGNRLQYDIYNPEGKFYTISNIYYDTADNRLIRSSLQKPVYKEKIRLRAYGVPKKDDLVFMEFKKKFRGVVNKRRTPLMLNEAYTFALTHRLESDGEYVNRQVLKELTYAFDLYNAVPKVYIAYDRCACCSKENADLRITFDKNIRTRREFLRLEVGEFGRLLLERDMIIMEIKHREVMPVWLVEELNSLSIRKISFSKYGTEYERMLRERLTEEKKICLNNY